MLYILCIVSEFESMCICTISNSCQDFGSLLKQLDSQQEYTLMQGEYPFKTGVAWTTRPCKGGESIAEQFEKAFGCLWQIFNDF